MLLNLRGLAYSDTGMTDTEIEMARLSGLRFSPRRFLKRGKGPESTDLSTSTEPTDYSRVTGTQLTTQLDFDEPDKKDKENTSKSNPAVISFALPTMTATTASSSSPV